MMKEKARKYLPLMIFLLLVTVVFGWMTFHQIKLVDYEDHIEFTKKLAADGYVYSLPHTLFAKLVIIVRALMPYNLIIRLSNQIWSVVNHKSYELAVLVLMVGAYLFTALVLWKRALRSLIEKEIRYANAIAILISAVLMIVGPIFLFTYPRHLYIGYFSPNPFQSPTYLLLRPLAILWFFIISDHYFEKVDPRVYLYTALLILLASSALPLFTMTFVPTIVLVFILFYVKKAKSVNWYLVIGTGIISAVILGSQFWVSYTSPGSDRIIFAPFKSFLHWSPNLFTVFFKIFMSIVFPLYVTINYWKDVSQKLSFQLGWVNFLVGLILAIFFAEKEKYTHGNFFWGPMLGVFILFVITTIHYLTDLFYKLQNKVSTWKDFMPAVLLATHLICGIIYFGFSIVGNSLIL